MAAPKGQYFYNEQREVPPLPTQQPSYTNNQSAADRIRGLDMYGRSYSVDAAQAAAATRQAQQNELSATHLQQMLDSNSPLMRQAAAMGAAQAGSRGLRNSSIAMGAAQGSMISHAQPFALQGAQAYQQAASESLMARNEAARLNAQLSTQARIAGMQESAAGDRAAMGLMGQAYIQDDQQSWQTGENEAQRGWQSSENLAQRNWQTGENEAQRGWQTGENEAQRGWQTGEREGTQNWQTGENESQRGWQSGENQANREWTTAENIRSNTLAWAQSQLQAYASIGMNREQARAQVLADIYSNPNLTAAEQRAAAANANAVFDKMQDQPWNPPVGLPSYDPTGGAAPPPPEQPPPEQPPPEQPPPEQPPGGDVGDGGSTGGRAPKGGRTVKHEEQALMSSAASQSSADQYAVNYDLNQRFGQAITSTYFPQYSAVANALPPVLV